MHLPQFHRLLKSKKEILQGYRAQVPMIKGNDENSQVNQLERLGVMEQTYNHTSKQQSTINGIGITVP